MASPSRKSTILSTDSEVLNQAKALSINSSGSAEDGVKAAVRAAQELRWKEANAEAIESSNAYMEKHGLPLDTYRSF